MKLNGKRVLVIGGGSGIGLATAHAAQREGAEVLIAGRSRETLAAAAQSFPGDAKVRTFSVDVAEEARVQALFAETGQLDHVVLTAVDAQYQLVTEYLVADMRRVLDSKLLGALLVAKHGAARLQAGGSLTFTSGIAADRPAPRGALISAANGALNSLARALALELRPIRVNAVSPGWVDTPIWDRAFGPDKNALQSGMAARLPVRRIGQPGEIADAILFLLTNHYTTGSVLHVDGGHSLV